MNFFSFPDWIDKKGEQSRESHWKNEKKRKEKKKKKFMTQSVPDAVTTATTLHIQKTYVTCHAS